MADEQKKIDVAAALAALAGGAVPSETETPSGGIPSETTVFSPPPPVPPVAKADASAGNRVPVPPPPRPQTRVVRPPPKSAGDTPKPSAERAGTRPAQPTVEKTPDRSAPPRLAKHATFSRKISPCHPPCRRPRDPASQPRRQSSQSATSDAQRPAPPPVAPVIPAEPIQEEAPGSMVEMEEDEETIAAAPDASAFAPRTGSHKPAHVAIYAKLFFRRTIIPILLTCGIMLPAIGVWSMLDHNAPLATVGTHVEILMIVVGAILLGLGIINALHVKHIMDTAAKQQNS